MHACPHCRERVISGSQKLFLKGPALCPACRQRFRLSPAGGAILAAGAAGYLLVIVLADSATAAFSAFAAPLAAVALYLLAAPLAPAKKTGPRLYLCPHCQQPVITWKQKYAVRPFRTAECPACRGSFTISPVIWAFYAPVFAVLLVQERLPHPFLAPALILAGILLVTIIKIKWIPLVRK
ncbi:MAG: hypothetical protein C4524_02640 [Candidatus Zixiibacteriota bacterium]|nr:MAG: hypothetical protein C4524_02640 [candidate division Zixibacteria bacterium]